MAVTSFELSEPSDGPSRYHVEFGAYKVIVGGINSVTGAWRFGESAAGSAVCGVEAVVCVGQPQTVSFKSHTDAWVRFALKNAAHVLLVLQRKEIHVTVILVVGG